MAATSGPSFARTASTLTVPSSFASTARTVKPSNAAVAGFVPCADFGNENLAPGRRFALRLDRRADRHHAAHFAVRARLRGKRDRLHAGQLDQPAAEFAHQRERALHRLFRLQRMNVGEARKSRHLLVEARIMLHRAGAERENAGVDGVILLRQADIMAYGLRLRKPRQTNGLAPRENSEPRFGLQRLFEIDAARRRRPDLENERLLNRKTPVTREGVNLARRLSMVQ